MNTRAKRELIWVLVGFAAGLVGMPLLVYATGRLTLGPYSHGGAARFFGDFLRSLARLEWQALALAVAPIALTLGWRIVRALRAPLEVDDTAAQRTAAVRREPTL
jgi:hypothetical protein